MTLVPRKMDGGKTDPVCQHLLKMEVKEDGTSKAEVKEDGNATSSFRPIGSYHPAIGVPKKTEN